MNGNDEKILACLGKRWGKTPEEIARKTGMTPNYVRSRLAVLQMQGKVRHGDRPYDKNWWTKI